MKDSTLQKRLVGFVYGLDALKERVVRRWFATFENFSDKNAERLPANGGHRQNHIFDGRESASDR